MGKRIKQEKQKQMKSSGKFNLILFLFSIGQGALAYFTIIFPLNIYEALWTYLTSLPLEDLGYIFLGIAVGLGVLSFLLRTKFLTLILFGCILCIIVGVQLSFPGWYNMVWVF
jgi:hypothetical protein